jgi:small nuclear ribonucleoprotein (snRNP)-like protein
VGRPVEIVMKDGTTYRGILQSADEEKISLAEETKRKNKKSKKMIAGEVITINMADIAKAKAIIIF